MSKKEISDKEIDAFIKLIFKMLSLMEKEASSLKKLEDKVFKPKAHPRKK